MQMSNKPEEYPITLSTEQGYESAYRFVAQFYNRELAITAHTQVATPVAGLLLHPVGAPKSLPLALA